MPGSTRRQHEFPPLQSSTRARTRESVGGLGAAHRDGPTGESTGPVFVWDGIAATLRRARFQPGLDARDESLELHATSLRNLRNPRRTTGDRRIGGACERRGQLRGAARVESHSSQNPATGHAAVAGDVASAIQLPSLVANSLQFRSQLHRIDVIRVIRARERIARGYHEQAEKTDWSRKLPAIRPASSRCRSWHRMPSRPRPRCSPRVRGHPFSPGRMLAQ